VATASIGNDARQVWMAEINAMFDQVVLADSDVHIAIQCMQYTCRTASDVVASDIEVCARRTNMTAAKLTLAQMLDDHTAHFHIHQIELNFIHTTVQIGAEILQQWDRLLFHHHWANVFLLRLRLFRNILKI
jgi:hypothetical protein